MLLGGDLVATPPTFTGYSGNRSQLSRYPTKCRNCFEIPYHGGCDDVAEVPGCVNEIFVGANGSLQEATIKFVILILGENCAS